MRVLYFNDQTEEFYDTPKDIYLLGSLYLKGKPYTNPKEAVDKEYVDNAFDNITSDNITEKIPASAYPAFGGDLTNKAKTNNFTLKAVGKAGRYHKPTFDSAGRITGGKTGKLTLNKNDISGIDFGKIEFLPKEDWDSINDWTKGFDRTKYLMLDDKTINFKKPVAINEKKIIKDTMVINEDQVMEVSEEFFRGSIKDPYLGKIDSLESDFKDINDFFNISGRPDIWQASLTPDHQDPVTNEDYRNINLVDEMGFDFLNDQNKMLIYVFKDHIFFAFVGEERHVNSFKLKLVNGKLPPIEDMNNKRIPIHVPKLGPINGSHDTSFRQELTTFLDDRIVIFVRAGGTGMARQDAYSIKRDEEGNMIGEWELARGGFGGAFNGFGFGRNSLVINDYSNAGYKVTGFKDGKFPRNAERLNGEFNVTPIGDLRWQRTYIPYGPLIYYKSNDLDNNLGNDDVRIIRRLSTMDDLPYGEWSEIPIPTKLSRGFHRCFTIRNKLIIVNLTRRGHPEGQGVVQVSYIDIDNKGYVKSTQTKNLTGAGAMSQRYFSGVLTSKSLIIYSNQYLLEFNFEGSEIDHNAVINSVK